MEATHIPEAFLKPVGAPDAPEITRLAIARAAVQGAYQEFDDPKPKPLWPQGTLPTGAIVPNGWQVVDRASKSIAPFAPRAHGQKLTDSLSRTSEDFFGSHNDYPFAIAIPDGFRVLNITHNSEKTGNGYDALAIYNDKNRELFIINPGLDGNGGPDLTAIDHDGGEQIPAAQQFLSATLGKLDQSPSHVTLVGHSLGGVLALSQAAKLANGTIPYHLISFDSIGSEPYVKTAPLSDETLTDIGHHSLLIETSGKLKHSDAAKFRVIAALHGKLFVSTNAHQFPDVLTDPKYGATVISYPTTQHDMEFITPCLLTDIANSTAPSHGLSPAVPQKSCQLQK